MPSNRTPRLQVLKMIPQMTTPRYFNQVFHLLDPLLALFLHHLQLNLPDHSASRQICHVRLRLLRRPKSRQSGMKRTSTTHTTIPLHDIGLRLDSVSQERTLPPGRSKNRSSSFQVPLNVASHLFHHKAIYHTHLRQLSHHSLLQGGRPDNLWMSKEPVPIPEDPRMLLDRLGNTASLLVISIWIKAVSGGANLMLLHQPFRIGEILSTKLKTQVRQGEAAGRL